MQLELIKGLIDGARPEPLFTVSEWAEANRYLSPVAAAEPGPWRTERTPYLKDIMDDLSAYSPVQRVVFMAGAQIGKTECGNNWLGYIMDAAPGPSLMVMPTDAMVERNSKLRIDTMIAATPKLREKIAPARSRDSGNTISNKSFPGGILMMAGANTGAGLRSMPVRNLFLDEVDAYPKDIDGEGSPVSLAEARTRTFGRKKIYIVSTPTEKNTSIIEREFEKTDQRYFFIPCPHCGGMQTLKFERLRWTEGQPETVVYDCEHCEQPIEHRHKSRMLTQGVWVVTKPENERWDVKGYHLNALYSPFSGYTWVDMVKEYEAALKDPTRMKAFINTGLAQTYEEKGEAPDYQNLHDRRELYPMNQPPKDVCFLTAGVDIQKDRIEFEIVGWCDERRSYSIDFRVLLGDTAQPDVWNELAKVLDEKWRTEDGIEMPLQLMAIDTGYNTSHVYAFCNRFDATRVIPVKGSDKLNVHVANPRQVHLTRNGKKVGAMKVWNVGVSVIKSELYGWLRQSRAEDGTPPAGYCHFPQYEQRYFRGLTAEELTYKLDRRGFGKYEWVKKFERNEPLDCRVYARAAATVVGIDRFTSRDFEAFRNSYMRTSTTTKEKKKRRQSEFWG